ncbi:MAG: DUF2845 domain-containing protein [Immundisolibacteraceae bacterium]|nr:DUF2845 domain-containing protein [Immundisolibacteraceae bacterium]
MARRLGLMLLLTLIALPGQAMRCGNRLVQKGDTKLEVVNKCGEPTFSEGSGIIEQEDEIAAADRLNDQLLLIGRHQSRFSQPVESWHYNCGANRFSRVLTFVGPYLQRIETAERGIGNAGCKQPPTHFSGQSADRDTDPTTAEPTVSRGVLDAAIEFRQLHQKNQAPDTTNSPTTPVFQWQDELGQWHYSSEPGP